MSVRPRQYFCTILEGQTKSIMVFLNRLIILIPHGGHEMSNMKSVDQKKKAIYLVSENFQGTLCKRGIACAVSFQNARGQNETFLLTSSSVVKEVNASEKPKQLIAERFSRKYFGDYRAEVSILTTIGKFTFLKIVRECKSHIREGWSTGPFVFNVDVPSSETKASALSPFCGRQKFKVVEFECNGNNTNIEENTEIPIETTSIVGAPIFIEKKNTQKRKSQYPVNAVHIGVVGLNSEGRLCSYYLNKDVLGEFCLVCARIHLVGLMHLSMLSILHHITNIGMGGRGKDQDIL